jgi:hypothetical protein
LNQAPPSEVTANVLHLFRELASREPAWHEVLQKSIKKKGRCPKKLRVALASLLDTDRSQFASLSGFADLLASEVFAEFETISEHREGIEGAKGASLQFKVTRSFLGRTHAYIKISKELTDVRRMETLAKLLSNLRGPFESVTLDFDGVEHVYVVGLAALKAWCSDLGVQPTIENASESTEIYLDNLRFSTASPPASRAHPESFYTIAIASVRSATRAASQPPCQHD